MRCFCLLFLSFIFILTGEKNVYAQADTVKRIHIAVFLPLYLDSAFDGSGSYRYDKNFPKFINPGLEFYEGLELAADTLSAENIPVDINVYDTRSVKKNIEDIVNDSAFDQTALIIGHVTGSELHELSSAAAHKEIPFINVNFPNDGGIVNNPELVILNSTLKTHCEGIYKFIQRNYATSNILYIRKKGVQEDRLRNYFADIEKNTASVPLKMKYIVLDDNINISQLIPYLDSNAKTICIVGSMDENFGKNICLQLASVNKTYRTKIFGMPTWDAITDFTLPAYTDQEIYYTTVFYSNPNDSVVSSIQQYFKNRFYSRPSDMVFRGYETIYRFSKLLALHHGNLNGSIGEKRFKVFNDFDIQPVFLDKQKMTLDYFENKKVYFIKKVNGLVTNVY